MNQLAIFLKDDYNKAIELKNKFKSIEDKEWNSITVLVELNVQIGHVFNVLNHNEYVDEKGRTWITNMGDELSDIILQLSYLNHLENNTISLDNYQNYNYKDLDGISILFGQLSEALLEKYGYRFTKSRNSFNNIDEFINDRITKLLLICFNYAQTNNIDLNKEFNIMYEDASKFIEKKLNNGNN